ncbi:MAG: hypothetical protein LBF60_08055 [Treponema sp.]|nr:hypothetical protein [Treponema sp.]
MTRTGSELEANWKRTGSELETNWLAAGFDGFTSPRGGRSLPIVIARLTKAPKRDNNRHEPERKNGLRRA